ncbi:MAG: hypothetical protein ACE5H8_04065 [Alphaproteobacteria bacterium]
MGLTLTLKDTELPASPAFIEFLHASLTGAEQYAGRWYAQEEEDLASDKERYADIQKKAREVMANPEGVERIVQSYRYFKEILIGRPETVQRMNRFRFFFIIGIPRTGGTYLTKQIFRAVGVDYTGVQNALAHDGFPHLALLSFKGRGNVHTNSLLQVAEYLTMVEIYFTQHGRLAYKGGVVVPKKFTKAVYNFPLVQQLFGTDSNYLITLRHPLSMIQSTLEKSGGMPEGGKFAVRSAIERWALDDWVRWGATEKDIAKMSYIEVMLGYWKRFHFQLALIGIPRMATARVVPYGAESMTGVVSSLYEAFGVDLEPEAFKVAKPPEFGQGDEDAGEHTVDDVATFWENLGLTFPRDEIAARH